MKSLSIFFAITCLLISSCAVRNSGWDSKTKIVTLSENELKDLKESALKNWKERVNQESLKKALSNFESLYAAQPLALENLIYLTRGYYLLADSHLENIEDKKKYYEVAASFGEKAMALNPQFQESVKSGKSVEESLGFLTKNEVPAIYWTAASLGKWAKFTGIAAALKYKTRIKAMIKTVEKLDPDYFYGATSRYWGGFYAIAPSFAGGDMNKSKEYFEKSLSISPEYLGTKVLMADVYYTKVGNKKDFEQTLKDVLASKFDNHPELGPENTLEKRKAQKLLEKINDLF